MSWQSLSEGVAYGAADFITSKISFGVLNNVLKSVGESAMKTIVLNIGKQIATDFTQGAADEAMKILADIAIMDDKSQMAAYLNDFLKEHPDKKYFDAVLATVLQALGQVAAAGGQSVASGLMFTGGKKLADYATAKGRAGIERIRSLFDSENIRRTEPEASIKNAKSLPEAVSKAKASLTASGQRKVNGAGFVGDVTALALGKGKSVEGDISSASKESTLPNKADAASTKAPEHIDTGTTLEQKLGQDGRILSDLQAKVITDIYGGVPEGKVFVETDSLNQIMRIEPLDASKGIEYYTAKEGNVGRVYEPQKGGKAFTDVTKEASKELVTKGQTQSHYDLARLQNISDFNSTAIEHIFLRNEKELNGYHYEGVPGGMHTECQGFLLLDILLLSL